ncbi:MAG: nicotinate-nucleotide adenylyltransferase [Halofilum sp. (in: g-proteobacteria)]|nr:nicotinate-nucleotide adenylyltransferase [Halofilum sp. (in: g-proteobacteria)]
MRDVGILGGTFDPVHFGHLRPAVEVRAALGLEHLRLIPARVSPLRDEPAASGEQRLAMLRAAIGDAPDLVVDARELDRPGPSYTADTLAALAAELPDARLHLVMGADTFASFERWDRWREILARAHIVVARRPGSPLQVPRALGDALVDDPARLREQAAGHVYVHGVTQLDISASAIRAAAAGGGDLRYLMPEATRRYIEEHRPYDP